MVLNNQWPFEHAGRAFFLGLTEQLVAAAEEMLHHVQPGESQWSWEGGWAGGEDKNSLCGSIRIVFVWQDKNSLCGRIRIVCVER